MPKLLYLMLLVLLSNIAFAQRKQVTGTISSKAGAPLQGVTVQSGNAITQTDAAGKFAIDAEVGKTIKFTYTGMKGVDRTITANDQDLSLQLEEDLQGLDAVVVVGYTTERKRDLKGAVTVVKMEDAMKETNANILASLQSRVPGLEISTDGAPGTGATINLRGLGSFNNNTPPLFVIDGVPTYDFNGLSPNDIESLQVLKDAASAAIYGARASSGVIVITTKKGKSKKCPVDSGGFLWSEVETKQIRYAECTGIW